MARGGGLFGARRGPSWSSPNDVSGAKSLTASGVRIDRREGERVRQVLQQWQQRSFDYYDLVPEIKFAAQFYSRMLAPLRLYAAEIDENGETKETDNPEAVAALERIQDPGGGRTALLSSYGRLMFLAGECLLFVSTQDDVERWEILSTDELRIDGTSMRRVKAPSLGAEEFRGPPSDDDASAWTPVTDDTAVAYRLWQRHPRFSQLADSTMQGVLSVCEELVTLTQAIRNRGRSRLAGAGILFIDESISPRPVAAAPDENPAEDKFLMKLIDTMVTPIADMTSVSALVPMLVRVSRGDLAKVADMVHHLQLTDPTQLYPEIGMRIEAIKRLAIGLDMPPEALVGLSESNHWSAWQINDQQWKDHGQPKAQQFVDDVTSSYYRPYLAHPDRLGPEEAKRYVIAYDPAAVVNNPDKAKDGKELHDRNAIGDKALRDAAGFTDEDAPTEEETARWVGVKVRDAGLAMTGVVTERPTGGGGPSDGPAPDDEPVDGPGDVEPGPPPEPTDDRGAETAALVARIIGASDLGLLRAREAAGARLKSFAKRDPAIVDQLNGTPAVAIPAAIGRDRVRQIGGPSERELVASVRPLIVDTLLQWGIDENVSGLVADQVMQHAARTLYQHRFSLPQSFEDYVTGLVTNGR